jgi:putative hydrolase of the HAD superfamily
VLADIDTWVLDLDNTLYSARSALAEQLTHGILSTIRQYYETDLAGARRIQSELVAEYGTSLRGAMVTGTIDPHEFLDFERRIDYSVIDPDPLLAKALGALPGRDVRRSRGEPRAAARARDDYGVGDRRNGARTAGGTAVADAGSPDLPERP